MTLDHQSIIEKKAKLKQAIRVLKQLGANSPTDLTNDEIKLGSVQHYLTIGIEAILDIGSHILTEDFALSPATYEEVIVQLGQRSIVPSPLAKLAEGMGKFRNKMIHEYANVDVQKIYSYLQIAPQQFEQFDQAFSEYLKANKK